VIWSDDTAGSAAFHHGAQPASSRTGSAIGRPPSGSVTESSQSQSAAACGAVAGAISSNTSKA
jgi:hypothetical protein